MHAVCCTNIFLPRRIYIETCNVHEHECIVLNLNGLERITALNIRKRRAWQRAEWIKQSILLHIYNTIWRVIHSLVSSVLGDKTKIDSMAVPKTKSINLMENDIEIFDSSLLFSPSTLDKSIHVEYFRPLFLKYLNFLVRAELKNSTCIHEYWHTYSKFLFLFWFFRSRFEFSVFYFTNRIGHSWEKKICVRHWYFVVAICNFRIFKIDSTLNRFQVKKAWNRRQQYVTIDSQPFFFAKQPF